MAPRLREEDIGVLRNAIIQSSPRSAKTRTHMHTDTANLGDTVISGPCSVQRVPAASLAS